MLNLNDLTDDGSDEFGVKVANLIYSAVDYVNDWHLAGRIFAKSSDARDDEGLSHLRLSLELYVNDLRRLYDRVAGWWLSEQPPALSPFHTSVVEYVLHAGCRMLACLNYARPGGPEVTGRYLAVGTGDIAPGFAAALRCEVTAMASRRRVGLVLGELSGWDPDSSPSERIWETEDTFASLPHLYEYWAVDPPPEASSWEDLTDAERLQRLDRWKEHLDGLDSGANRSGESKSEYASQRLAVELPPAGSECRTVIVMGVPKQLKSTAMMDLVAALVGSSPYGLSYDAAKRKHTNASTKLNDLCRDDAHWRCALELPNGKGGYRIRTLEEARAQPEAARLATDKKQANY